MMLAVSTDTTCGARVTALPQPSLTQIRKIYAIEWHGLALSVETGVDCWMVHVRVPGDSKMLYEAHRGTLAAAKAAGLEFAIFHDGDSTPGSPERLAGALTWKEQWFG